MLDRDHFKRDSKSTVEWIDKYLRTIREFPVKSKVAPGEIAEKLDKVLPESGESMSRILKDFEEIIVPGITHWQHPNFHAYFSANSSTESVIAEMLTAAMGAQCMIWETSPAAAELEQRMMEWLRDSMGLPHDWHGVIQDTASTATLVALLTAREVATDFTSNDSGVPNNLRVYCTNDAHSSIDKGVGIAGIGRNNIVRILTRGELGMDPEQLEAAIVADKKANKVPCAVVLSLGTTGTVSIDRIADIAPICQRHEVWLHVDAAFAGSASILPEYRWIMDGIEGADSFVFNPHKWLFTNFDCTAYFVKSPEVLVRTFEILPEYLKTSTLGLVNDYRDWGIQLGRRFRALKLWFVLRSYGKQGIQERLRHHLSLSEYFVEWVKGQSRLILMTRPILNFCCFRYDPTDGKGSIDELNSINMNMIKRLNANGNVYLSHTKVGEHVVFRVVIGQTYIEKSDVDVLISAIGDML